MEIIFNPPVNNENKYIETMVQPLREKGYVVHPLDGFFSSKKHFQSIKLVHLNWFENVDDRSAFRAWKSFFRKMFVLCIIRFYGKRLVWTMHNRASHEKKSGHLSRMIVKYLIRWSDMIIIHSKISRSLLLDMDPTVGGKIGYLPHPDFVDVYGPLVSDLRPSDPAEPLSLLFVGAVKPYKNIELLIRVMGEFKGNVRLTVAGNPSTSDYEERIAKLAASAGNIELMLRFIPDHELPRLMAASDLLVLPYDLESSLNSGTVILAFSYKKTVICPEIGTIEDLEEAKAHVFHYRYSSEEEHLAALKQEIEKALRLKRSNPAKFHSLGENLYDHVKTVHSKNSVGHQLLNLYQTLLD